VELDNNWEQIVPQSVLAQLRLQQPNLPRSDRMIALLKNGTGGGAPIGSSGAIEEKQSGGRQSGTRINNLHFVASMFQSFWELTAVTCKMLKERIRSDAVGMPGGVISSGVSLRARRSVRSEDAWMGSVLDKIVENAASVSSEIKWRSPAMRVWLYGLRDVDISLVLVFWSRVSGGCHALYGR